jgi:hypothetical protein
VLHSVKGPSVHCSRTKQSGHSPATGNGWFLACFLFSFAFDVNPLVDRNLQHAPMAQAQQPYKLASGRVISIKMSFGGFFQLKNKIAAVQNKTFFV